MQTLQSQSNLIEVEQTLAKNAYFSRSPLPGFADGVILRFLLQNKKYPDKKVYPNFYHWYIIMRQFSQSAYQGWIREKRYIENQSQKCLMLIAQIFAKEGRKALQQLNRKKSLDSSHSGQNPEKNMIDSLKLQPLDPKNIQNQPHKAQYSMIVQLRTLQNIEEVFNRFYKLKIKIKELNCNKMEKSVFLKFITQTNTFEEAKEEIQNWDEVRHVLSKESKTIKETQGKKKLPRAVSIR